jgi:hypothetical protein
VSILHARIMAQHVIPPAGTRHPAGTAATPATSPAAALDYDPATWTVSYADLHPLYPASGDVNAAPVLGNGPDAWQGAAVVPAGRP